MDLAIEHIATLLLRACFDTDQRANCGTGLQPVSAAAIERRLRELGLTDHQGRPTEIGRALANRVSQHAVQEIQRFTQGR